MSRSDNYRDDSVVSAGGQFVSTTEQAAPSRSKTGTNWWVGIVDDDASIRCSLARAFKGNGIPVETFGSAEEYLSREVSGEPRCIVLDVQLGARSGFDLRDRLVSDGVAPPIIFITAHEMSWLQLERCAGSSGYLRKPFDTDALLALVRPHLDRIATE